MKQAPSNSRSSLSSFADRAHRQLRTMEFDDVFDFIDNNLQPMDSMNELQQDLFEFPLFHSTPSLPRAEQQPIRSIDFPSTKKHYGFVTIFDQQLPIIYRLINDKFYVPYIRFSYVLHVFQHSSYNDILVNVRNLPVLEMTPAEKIYYDELCSTKDSIDWSNSQLLSVAILDGVLSIILHLKNSVNKIGSLEQWQETLNRIRHEAHNRWILDETTVATRLQERKDANSASISTSNVAQRRSFFEERLDLSIVDGAGGFIQIDSYVYPYVKNQENNQIYINLDDIRQDIRLPPSHMIYYCSRDSPLYHTYSVIMEQARSNYEWSAIRHGRNSDLTKALPSNKTAEYNGSDELPLVPLETLLCLFLNKYANSNMKFVQLFEASSLDDIEANYKNNVARQFIMTAKRRGGLVNGNTPCLLLRQKDRQTILTPSEKKTKRIISSDERLYLNMVLLYHGLCRHVLTKKKQWYWNELDDKENVNIQSLLFTTG